jgi:hypothetical protein
MQITIDHVIDTILIYHREKVEDYINGGEEEYRLKALAALEIINRMVGQIVDPEPGKQRTARKKIRHRLEAIYGTAMVKEGH